MAARFRHAAGDRIDPGLARPVRNLWLSERAGPLRPVDDQEPAGRHDVLGCVRVGDRNRPRRVMAADETGAGLRADCKRTQCVDRVCACRSVSPCAGFAAANRGSLRQSNDRDGGCWNPAAACPHAGARISGSSATRSHREASRIELPAPDPSKLGTELLHIEVEDHYLRVHTNLGSDLILLRLSDAIGELDQAIGRQVHRSHWVSRRAVAGIERNGIAAGWC